MIICSPFIACIISRVVIITLLVLDRCFHALSNASIRLVNIFILVVVWVYIIFREIS